MNFIAFNNNLKNLFLTLGSVLLLLLTSFGQNRTISGIISHNGKPLKKVLIIDSKGDASAKSNHSGEYSITLPSNSTTLSFSKKDFLAQEVDITNDSIINIELQVANFQNLMELSLEEILNTKVSIASTEPMKTRDSPGIISVISKEEITNSGASDLIEVLRLVPGIEMSVDVWGVTGISIRGNIGYIGRVLLMLDGIETNELLFATSLIVNHFPVSNIEKIEIIRGPGSSIYGGFAELGVINIITKSGSDLNGLSTTLDYGQMKGDIAHSNATVSLGKKHKDFEFAVHGFYANGNRSDRDYTDSYGNSFNMANQAQLNSTSLNSNLKYKDLSLRFIYDNYKTTTRDWEDHIVSKDYLVNYESIYGELKYDWKINDKLILTPKYNLHRNNPWNAIEEPFEDDEIYYQYSETAVRNKFNLTANYNLNEKINIIGGGEYTLDHAKDNLGDPFWNGKTKISYNNIAFLHRV